MLRSTAGLINQDLDFVKVTFLNSICQHYAELSANDIEPQMKSTPNTLERFFPSSNEKIELDNFEGFNAEDYGNLNIGKAKNWTTGEIGFERLMHFFDETKNCQTVDEFMHIVYEIYSEKNLRINLGVTLALATAEVAVAKLADGTIKSLSSLLEDTKNACAIENALSVFDYLRILLENDKTKILVGDLVLRQIQKYDLGYPVQNLQQILYRSDSNKYYGDPVLIEKYESELAQENIVAESSFSAFAHC